MIGTAPVPFTLGGGFNPTLFPSFYKSLSSGGSLSTVNDTTILLPTGYFGNQYYIKNNPLVCAGLSIPIGNFKSDNSGVAIADVNGFVNYINSGSANISFSSMAEFNGMINGSLNINLNPVTGVTGYSFFSHPTSSLAYHCKNQIDNIITGNPVAAMPLYSIYNPFSGIVTRNQNCFLNGVDISCVPVYPFNYRSCLVTSRHLISAHHIGISSGFQFIFLGNDNNVYTGTVFSGTDVGDVNYTDMRVLTLQTDLPATIVPAKVMPTGISGYLPCVYINFPGTRVMGNTVSALNFAGNWVPAVGIHSENTASIFVVYQDYLSETYFGASTGPTGGYTKADLEYSFYQNLHGGDSANPLFFIISGQLVLLGTYYTLDRASSIVDDFTGISAVLGTGYSLNQFNLSGFTYY
jgi:hypothetical protein